MKALKRILIILMVTLVCLVTKVFATTATVSSTALRVREKANTDSKIITNLYEADKVEILEDNGEWCKIKYNNYEGYVKREFLNISKNNTSNNDKTNISDENKVNSNIKNNDEDNKVSVYDSKEDNDNSEVLLNESTYLKKLPSFISSNISELNIGTKLNIKSELNNWIQVTDGTVTGWILKNKTNKPLANTQITTSDIESQNNEIVNNLVSDNTILNNISNNSIENTMIENSVNNTNLENNNTIENNVTTSVSENKRGKINVETGRVRKSASSSAEVIDFLDYGDIVEIESEEGDWYKITSKTISGYVSKKIVNEISNNVSSRSLIEERKLANESNIEINLENDSNKQNTSNLGVSVVEYAKNYLGYSYVVGGKTPSSGFDCSGFTKYIFSNFGINLASVASEQIQSGTEVSRENLIEGDLILFYNEAKTKIGHVGIYIGNGEFIHSANPQRGVVIDNLNTNSYYNDRYVTARRIVN